MNTEALIKAVAKETGLRQKDVRAMYRSGRNIIRENVKAGNKVKLHGLGEFSKRERKERKGRNINTGETILLPARNVPFFEVATAFKNQVK